MLLIDGKKAEVDQFELFKKQKEAFEEYQKNKDDFQKWQKEKEGGCKKNLMKLILEFFLSKFNNFSASKPTKSWKRHQKKKAEKRKSDDLSETQSDDDESSILNIQLF